MTPQQLATLKAAILADPTQAALAAQNSFGQIAAIYQANASPDYWVWRSSISRFAIYHETSPSGTSWDWTTFKNQTVPEQGAWREMFMGDTTNFANGKVRAGVSNIFGAANAQTVHCFASARRKANIGEKLFAIETPDTPPAKVGQVGGVTNVATLVFEGLIQDGDVQAALQLA
jgi:hypothetical protein